MNAPLGEIDLLRSLAAQLAEAKHGEKTGLVDAAARTLTCSVQDVYRRLRVLGIYDSGRKPRKDRGRISVTEDVAMAASALVVRATRKNGKRTTKITDALGILQGKGAENAVALGADASALDVSTSTLSRAMRRYGCHPDMLSRGTPHVSLRSLHPNHCWQIDASNCVLFYLPKGGLQVMDEAKFYKNKPANVAKIEKERVWRYVITDHYSGTVFVRYVQQAGECAQALVDVFLEAIQPRGNDDPMHGVPFHLTMDPGSANTAHMFKGFLARMKVEQLVHSPGNSRAKGQTEQAQNLVECKFEGRLAFMPVGSLQELQEAADRWRKHYNAFASHGRHGRSRNECWLTIREEQLRIPPSLELCRALCTMQPKKAKVSDGMTISHAIKGYGRNEYDVRYLPGLVPGCRVEVIVNPYRAPAVDVVLRDARGDETVWTVEPIERDEAGFRLDSPVIGERHQALPDTLADTRTKEIEAATARETKAGPYRTPGGIDIMADVREAPTYITRRGRDLGLDASRREIAPLSVVEAAKRLRGQLGAAWTAESYAWLAQRYPNGVPETELDGIAARMVEPDARPAALKLVAGGAR